MGTGYHSSCPRQEARDTVEIDRNPTIGGKIDNAPSTTSKQQRQALHSLAGPAFLGHRQRHRQNHTLPKHLSTWDPAASQSTATRDVLRSPSRTILGHAIMAIRRPGSAPASSSQPGH